MVSASALEAHGAPLAQPFHDGYLMKPIDIPRLVETIRQLLKIEWQYEAEHIPQPRWKPETGSRPPVKYVEELIGLGQLGLSARSRSNWTRSETITPNMPISFRKCARWSTASISISTWRP